MANETLGLDIMGTLGTVVERTGWMFYLISPNKTTFEDVEDLPPLMLYTIPMFFSMLALEVIILFLKGEGGIRINDGIVSCAHGVMQQCMGLIVKAVTVGSYVWFYDRRFFSLDWNSLTTWWVAAIGSDFAYYWIHRFVHEVNFAWSSHQVHHSSEEYNLTTALRQSAFQAYFNIPFVVPMALIGVPLPMFLVHQHFNLIYQFWIHTTLIKTIGPLEWILNTPSHHRVHHGANRWCLDKNYAGWLIIWDRMFGTFEPERDDDEIVYGLVDQPQTFNPIYLQLFYFKASIQKALSMDNFTDKLKGVLYGPGWFPGTERLGDLEQTPDVRAPRKKYDPSTPAWLRVYVLGHFILVTQIASELPTLTDISLCTILIHTSYMLVTMMMIGAFFDNQWWAPVLEAARCGAMMIYTRSYQLFFYFPTLNAVVPYYFAFSTLLWIFQARKIVMATVKSTKVE